jgi:hypothetical protein
MSTTCEVHVRLVSERAVELHAALSGLLNGTPPLSFSLPTGRPLTRSQIAERVGVRNLKATCVTRVVDGSAPEVTWLKNDAVKLTFSAGDAYEILADVVEVRSQTSRQSNPNLGA